MFLPLFSSEMMILSLFFLTLWFYPAISKWRETLLLLCEVPVTVLTFGQKDDFTHVFLPLSILCVFIDRWREIWAREQRRGPSMALFASLKSHGWKYYSLIYRERKTLFLRWNSTAHKRSEHGLCTWSYGQVDQGHCGSGVSWGQWWA